MHTDIQRFATLRYRVADFRKPPIGKSTYLHSSGDMLTSGNQSIERERDWELDLLEMGADTPRAHKSIRELCVGSSTQ